MAESQFVERMTPLDLLMPEVYIGALLAFQTDHPSSVLLQKLQSGLETVCERVPWLRGRVFPVPAAAGHAPTLEIRWTAKETSPQVVDKGSISATYDELSKVGMPLASIPADMWPTPGVVTTKAESGSGAPVFAASLFRFADGKAIGLCIRAHHKAMDGFGFAEIIKLWARNVGGSEHELLSFPPALKRSSRLATALTSNANAATLSDLDVLFEKHPEYSRNPPEVPTKFPACTSEILRISTAKVETLKEELKAYMPTRPTTNTLACVLLWSTVTRARMQRTRNLDNQTSRLPMAVNGRKRLDADLVDPHNPYLGNAIVFSVAELAARDVSDCSGAHDLLAEVCRIVAQSQSPDSINAGHIGEVCHLVEHLGDYRSIFPGWELFGSRDLFITSWTDLDLYGLNFGDGFGGPQFVRIPYAEADGNAIILPRKKVPAADAALEEGLEIVVMLRRDDLEALKKDDFLRETLGAVWL